jgi:hypothetical protein
VNNFQLTDNSLNEIQLLVVILLRFILRSFGAHFAVAPTIPSVINPPKITEGTSPISLAATPDSNEPISLEDPMKMLFTEATLPRISSGATSCIVAERITTLMLSNIPLRANNPSDR